MASETTKAGARPARVVSGGQRDRVVLGRLRRRNEGRLRVVSRHSHRTSAQAKWFFLHRPQPQRVEYTLNSDCTGTYTILASGGTSDIFVAPNGEELALISTVPPGSIHANYQRRVAPR
jgi:hypothetical protein